MRLPAPMENGIVVVAAAVGDVVGEWVVAEWRSRAAAEQVSAVAAFAGEMEARRLLAAVAEEWPAVASTEKENWDWPARRSEV